MVKTPTEIYKTENVDKDVIFYHTSSVSGILRKRLFSRLINRSKIMVVQLLQEQVASFEESMKHNDIFDINKNFSIVLPFRNFNFSFESKVGFMVIHSFCSKFNHSIIREIHRNISRWAENCVRFTSEMQLLMNQRKISI